MLWVILTLILASILAAYFTRNKAERFSNSSRFLPTVNSRYWPTYYYSFPYQYAYSGAFPEDMYTRMRYWSPGFYTGTGWKYQLRPGMGFKYWPRNRWVRKTRVGNNDRYYISQRGDYTHDPKFLLKYGAKP